MNIPALSIRRPVMAWMLMSALIIFGAISFLRMGVSQLPDVDFPVLNISAELEGAAPEVIESDVLDPIEDAVMTVQGVRSLGSRARTGSGSVAIEFELGVNIDTALQEVQTKLAAVQRQLPDDLDPPVITKTNPEDQPIMWLTVTSDSMDLKDQVTYVRNKLKDKFSTVPGVGEVFLGGYVEPNLRVWVSREKLNEYYLSINDVISTIQNEHSERPAGQIQAADREFNVRTLGEAKSLEDFSKLIINTRGGAPNFVPIELGKVARVEEGLADIRRISRVMGKRAIGLGIRKQRGSNAVEVAHAVQKKMEEVSKDLPPGLAINVNFNSTKFVEEAVGELNFTLILSALLTALVCWMFLGSWSATFNILLAIPTSIIGTFIVLYFSGFTLNTFTLLGLSLAIGIVVDDAIMVLENIVRHREMGKSLKDAALDGASEIQFSAMAATVAVVAIFLPVAFMKGAIGEFFFQFGVTMTAAVLLSLVEALTLTPMRCASFLGDRKRSTSIGRGLDSSIEWLSKAYRMALNRALSMRWVVILVSLTVFAASLYIVKYLNKEFVPAQDQSLFLIRIQTPPGSSLEHTDSKFKEAEFWVSKRPEIVRYFSSVGGFGGGEINSGVIFVTLKDRKDRELSQTDLMGVYRKELSKIPGIKVSIQDLSMRGFSASRGFPIEVSLRGPEWETLGVLSKEIMAEVEKTGLATDVDTDYQLGLTEVQIIPDRVKASMRGVSISAISQVVNASIGGVVVGKYAKGGRRYDIRVRLEDFERLGGEDILKLRVRNNRGEMIELSQVTRIEKRPSLQQISRTDRERAISIFGNVAPGKSQSAAMAAIEKIGKEKLPPGYRLVQSGSAKSFKESFDSLIVAMILGLIVSYMILASQFNSFIDPVTVLLALPFSISGAFVSLWIGGQSLNIYSMIGLILLMGIVKKNSILLVDFTNQARESISGISVRDALLDACPKRLRPILMTSIATVAGAVPPALAFGPGAESRIPMAIAVIGGVIASTLLTLFVVPCAYSLFNKS